MSYHDCLTPERIFEIFREEISAHAGEVRESFNEGGGLFVRSVLPSLEEIRVGDFVQGGVAMRATEGGVWVYPYVFRLVCKNGQIMARSAEGRGIEELDTLPAIEAETLLRETIEACCQPEAFATAAGQMRTAAQHQLDIMLTMMPFLERLRSINHDVARQVLHQFIKGRDKTRYGLINVVTSIARDTVEHEQRWKLEEFAGEIAFLEEPERARESRVAESNPELVETV